MCASLALLRYYTFPGMEDNTNTQVTCLSYKIFLSVFVDLVKKYIILCLNQW